MRQGAGAARPPVPYKSIVRFWKKEIHDKTGKIEGVILPLGKNNSYSLWRCARRALYCVKSMAPVASIRSAQSCRDSTAMEMRSSSS